MTPAKRAVEIRVLFVTTIAGTASAFLLPFARHLRQLGHAVDLAAAGASDCRDCTSAFSAVFDVPWSRSPLRPGNVRALYQVRSLLRSGGYTLVHVHTPVAAFVTRLAVASVPRPRRPKVLYTAHGFHFCRGRPWFANAVYLALEKLAARWTDGLIVINEEDEAAARRHRLAPAGRIWHVPGIGVDTERYHPGRVTQSDVDRVRAALGLGPTDQMFLMVAEFASGKRHRDAISALSRLARPSVHLAFAGTGPLLEAAKKHADEVNLKGRVHFLGFRDDVPALMRAAAATLMPSEREGLNRSVMESLALEVPVIGTNARGVRDLLQTGCGLIVQVGDVEGLARAMEWVLDHPAEAFRMAQRGRELMVRFHDIRRILDLHDEVYCQVLGIRSEEYQTPGRAGGAPGPRAAQSSIALQRGEDR